MIRKKRKIKGDMIFVARSMSEWQLHGRRIIKSFARDKARTKLISIIKRGYLTKAMMIPASFRIHESANRLMLWGRMWKMVKPASVIAR